MLDLRDRIELRELAALVAAIRGASANAQPLLVGAMARDILFGYAHDLWAPRATHDMDFAFCLEGWAAFATLRAALLQNPDFRESGKASHGMVYRGTTRLDILPFGGMEQADRTILWPAPTDTRMNLVGYREASAGPVRALLPEGQDIDVVSIAGFALLKLFAWHDRKNAKDAGDLGFALQKFIDAGNHQRLYVDAAHLLESAQFDYDDAGAWLLGRDVGALVALSPGSDAVQKALALLDIQLDGTQVQLVAQMGGNADRNVRALAAFRAGLAGTTIYPRASAD